jgi:hypothetical protein
MRLGPLDVPQALQGNFDDPERFLVRSTVLSVGDFTLSDLDCWLEGDLGAERVGDVALPMCQFGEFQDSLLLHAGTDHNMRPQC